MAHEYAPTNEQREVAILGSNEAGTETRRLVITDKGAKVDLTEGFEIGKFDYIALTYVAVGNGAGEIETVVYRQNGSGGTIVATLTLAYNGDNEISSITKS